MPNLPLAHVPGHVDTQPAAELRGHVTGATLDQIVKALTDSPPEAFGINEPGTGDIVFEGGFDDVNRLYYENGWTDGLPIVPPTKAKIDAFLEYSPKAPDEELGVVLPDNRRLTPRIVAVNGVMAGCQPRYMPVLVALAEAMADPRYGVEHSGNTPGAETLIILNGPIVKELGFNYTQGALRDGFQANTTVGRFWRLLLINGAGFRLHQNDKGTYGNTFRVVLAENEDVLGEIGWEPTCTDFGLAPGTNAVTISRFTGGDVLASAFGQSAESLLPYLCDGVVKQHGWELCFTAGIANGTLRPLLVLSPVLARTIAASGFSKQDVKQYLFDHARVSARQFERYIGEWTNLVPGRPTLKDMAGAGRARAHFGEGDDPNRAVPIVAKPSDFMVAVTGDPLRTNAYTFSHNGMLGYPVSKPIELPASFG